MDKILFYNYSLSVFLARGQKDLVRKGTWFLLANELFFVSVSLAMFILSRCSLKLPNAIILGSYLIIWYITFYGVREWILSQLETRDISGKYKSLEQRKTVSALIGFLLFVGSFCFFLIVGILTFQGYLNK